MSNSDLEKQSVKEILKQHFGDNVLYYLKFTNNQQWAQDILDGKLFMNKLQYYRDIEAASGKKGQGDASELQARIFDVNLQFSSHETSFSFPLQAKSISFEFVEDKNTPVFCIMGLTIEDMEIGEVNDDYVELMFPFKTSDINELRNEFGKYVVLLNPTKFEESLGKKLLSDNVAWIYGKVIYCPPNSFERIQAFSEESPRRFLYKDEYFKYQKEFRLALDKEIDKFMILDVGSLADAGKILTVEEFAQLKLTANWRKTED
jgi:hypothetical protein